MVMTPRPHALAPADFGRTLWYASRRKLLVFLFAVTATAGASVGSTIGGQPVDGSHIFLDAPQFIGGGVDDLVRGHDCWTGDPPPGAGVPTHVVVSRNGSAPQYAGGRLTRQALDQLLGRRQHNLVVYAYCR
jgi:hypothetical protein